MLAHNIGTNNFSDYKKLLKIKTSNQLRYKEKIDIIDEETIFNLMKNSRKPNKTSKVIPSVIINHFSSQSLYIYMMVKLLMKMDIGLKLLMMKIHHMLQIIMEIMKLFQYHQYME